MSAAPSLGRLLAPRGVALVGVPGDVSRPGARPLHSLRRHGYGGRIYLVNPGRREIAGLPVYRSVASLPGPVDVAWIGLPAAQAADVVGECGRAAIPFAIVLGAGFAEAGGSGEAEQARLRDAAQRAGVRLVGPNTVGFVNAWDRVALTFSTIGEIDALVPGPLAILSQSGGLGGCLVNRAQDRAFGVGLFVSTGNEADLTLADYLEWIGNDGRAKAIACLVEQVREPDRFARAVRHAAARGVPVVALKLGGSAAGARAARSHTGALVGARDVWRAWARSVGLLEAEDLDQLVEIAAYLARTPPLEGTRLGMVTSSGGVAVMLADALEPRGFTFPMLAPGTVERVAGLLPGYATVTNPLDITAGLPEETFGEVLRAVLGDPCVDAVVVPLTMATAEGGRARAEQVVKAAREVEKPLAVCWAAGSLVREGFRTLDEAQVPLFDSVGRCAAALGASLAQRRFCERVTGARVAAPGPAMERLGLPERGGPLPWAEVRSLLATAGLRLAPEVTVTTEAAACAAAAGLAYPVAVKLLGPLHKTEAGGVRLGLRNGEELLAAVRDLLPRGEGCLIQPMLEGVEVLVGALRDPLLGAFVVLAPGGVYAELSGERAMRPAPLEPADAGAMLGETPALAALLGGYRGRAAADRPALVDALVRAAALAAALGPRLAELDLNPIMVGREGSGATVVDARIILGEC
ncbi:MAG: acetate--CoA ligase family protein [Candidatus Rokubacteria bacterium]|nr:acetate--CoA ligase family protein [Candidatus Rokubacteria bacterium]